MWLLCSHSSASAGSAWGCEHCSNRRLVVPDVLRRYLTGSPLDLTAPHACGNATDRLRRLFDGVPGGFDVFLNDGPVQQPAYAMLMRDILDMFGPALRPAATRVLIDRLRGYYLTQQGEPRKAGFTGTGFNADDCVSAAAWRRHRDCAAALAPAVAEIIRAFRRDLNVVLSRGVWRILAVALTTYRHMLEAHALLDFSGVLERALDLLKQMDEFARSRYRLEARYHHVLVDEFQDTSRAQWELVAQLVRSWGEGLGVSAEVLTPSIFVVGDRKQSIYSFRDAEVAVFDDAADFIRALRPQGQPRQAISVSFRAVPALLAFVNDVFDEVDKVPTRHDAFRYDERDRFPVTGEGAEDPPLGVVTGETGHAVAEAVADEIAQLLRSGMVRDRHTGVRRPARPADVGILFRSRESHRGFEAALERRGIPTYVYRGLGFFEAAEIQDVVAALRFLARPTSDLRAAAFLRSRIVRLSDDGVMRLSPRLAAAVACPEAPGAFATLKAEDQMVMARLRAAVSVWLQQVDLTTPAELLDDVLRQTGYAYELQGPRRLQAWENLKKLRGLIRRVQNRGYATLERIAEHLDCVAIGDDSNAAISRDRCGESDDCPCRQRPRISRRVRGEHGTRDRQHSRAYSRRVRCRRRAVGGDRRLSVRERRGRPGA